MVQALWPAITCGATEIQTNQIAYKSLKMKKQFHKTLDHFVDLVSRWVLNRSMISFEIKPSFLVPSLLSHMGLWLVKS